MPCHPHKDAHTYTKTHTQEYTHLPGFDGISDTARLTKTNHPIANYYMLYTNRHIVKCCLPRVERIELPCLNTSHCIARLIPLRPLSSSLHSSSRGILLSPQCNGSGLTVSIALRWLSVSLPYVTESITQLTRSARQCATNRICTKNMFCETIFDRGHKESTTPLLATLHKHRQRHNFLNQMSTASTAITSWRQLWQPSKAVGSFNKLYWVDIFTRQSLVGQALTKTLPKAQQTRGLSSSCQSNFLRSYHKFRHKSWAHFIFRIPSKHQLKISTKHQHLHILTKPSFGISTKTQLHNLYKTSAAKCWTNSSFKILPELQFQTLVLRVWIFAQRIQIHPQSAWNMECSK